MRPVVTVEEMKAVDAAAAEPIDVLVERAGAAVARAALDLLGGTYGRRVVVVAGKGNNGADGRAAAARLSRRGVRVTVIDAADAPDRLPEADLVVDAAYGTGFRGEYLAPDPAGAAVLAVDIPSGLQGDTGVAGGEPMRADATVTFAALKPGLLLGEGPDLAGRIDVADVGLDVGRAHAHVVDDGDMADLFPRRSRRSHKWQQAVRVVAGSPGMTGAAALTASAAMRSGAGYVRLGVPGADARSPFRPLEVVTDPLPARGWAAAVLEDLDRFAALVIGPGLGRDDETLAEVRTLVDRATVPVVVDADALLAYERVSGAPFTSREAGTVLTPHDGEYARLAGEPPGDDRLRAARALAEASGATVLLKGSTTVVADPDGDALISTSGSSRLATAGTGDVLSGVIGGLLAGGLLPDLAAALGAHAHGGAAAMGPAHGLMAGDLLELLPRWLDHVVGR